MSDTNNKEQNREWSTFKKWIVSILIILLTLVVILGGTICALYIRSATYKPNNQKPNIDTKSEFVTQGNENGTKRAIYDKHGNRLQIKGINAGNVLVQEGWMSPFDNDPKKDEDGNLIKDKDGNLTYAEFTQEDFEEGLSNNPNLKDNKDELMNLYYKSFFSEDDFKKVKELQFNTIRLPFYWRNILNDDFTRKDESVAFSYLDWFVEQCKVNDLYAILDLHGVPGSQNGFEHSGLFLEQPTFWHNETYENAVVDLWDYVSEHYTNNRKDIAPWILSYDVINEPQSSKNKNQDKYCTDYQDKLYKVIRENNDQHLITLEFMWDYSVCPNPDK